MGPAKIAQRLHLALEVIAGNAHDLLTQVIGDTRPVGRRVKRTGIEQLIKQRRVATDLLGNPDAACTQPHQLTHGLGIFDQQYQIGTAAQNTLHQGKDAAQGLSPVGTFTTDADQQRHKGVEAIADAGHHGFHTATVTQCQQLLRQ